MGLRDQFPLSIGSLPSESELQIPCLRMRTSAAADSVLPEISGGISAKTDFPDGTKDVTTHSILLFLFFVTIKGERKKYDSRSVSRAKIDKVDCCCVLMESSHGPAARIGQNLRL